VGRCRAKVSRKSSKAGEFRGEGEKRMMGKKRVYLGCGMRDEMR
jgi:hypothetical protein